MRHRLVSAVLDGTVVLDGEADFLNQATAMAASLKLN